MSGIHNTTIALLEPKKRDLSSLPTEVLMLIFEDVDDYFDLKALQATCKTFRAILENARFDRRLFRLVAANDGSNRSDWPRKSGSSRPEPDPEDIQIHPLIRAPRSLILSVLTGDEYALPLHEAASDPPVRLVEVVCGHCEMKASITADRRDGAVQAITVAQVVRATETLMRCGGGSVLPPDFMLPLQDSIILRSIFGAVNFPHFDPDRGTWSAHNVFVDDDNAVVMLRLLFGPWMLD